MNEREMQDELERRLRGLNEALPEERGFTERVMMRIQAEEVSPAQEKDYRFWRWCMKGVIGIAASAVVGVAVWQLSVGSPRTAYAVEDIPQRMMGLKTLHLKGEVYSSDGMIAQTIELYVERPGRMRMNGVPIRTTGRGGAEEMGSMDVIVTPEGRMQIESGKKRVEKSPETAIDSELQTEQILQQNVQMLLGSGEDFKKVRSEKAGGILADVYESDVDLPGEKSRVEVFMNPATGLPVRSAIYSSRVGNSGKPEMVFDSIEPDAAIPAGTFAFDVPGDYDVVKGAGEVSSMIAEVNDAAFGVRFAIALDKKSALVCWRAYNVKRPGEDLGFLNEAGNKLVIRGNGGVAYEERLLRADETAAGYHWRWSLVKTERPARAWGNAMSMSMQVHGGTSSDAFMAVTVPAGELADVVERAQRVTLPEGGKGMTLKEIEEAGR